jgi:hypothetical protein
MEEYIVQVNSPEFPIDICGFKNYNSDAISYKACSTSNECNISSGCDNFSK